MLQLPVGLGASLTMRRRGVDCQRLLAVRDRLGDATIDPAVWPELLDQISLAAAAGGAALLQTDIRTPDIPRSAGVDELMTSYFANGWHLRDVRADRGVPLLLRGEKVVIDQDVLNPDETQKLDFYTENLRPFGFQWFAAIGFMSGPALWVVSIQRTVREGPFSETDKQVLARLSKQLTETATLSRAVGRAILSNVKDALDLVRLPALVLDRMGVVLDSNDAAEKVFDEDLRVKDRRLWVRDQRAKAALDSLTNQLRVTPDASDLDVPPIVVQRRDKHPVVIRTLPINGAARSPFLGARALLVFSDLSRVSRPLPETLSRIFGLSIAEAKVAALMANGQSPEEVADAIGVTCETVRKHLKAVFAKTATHRQAELVALLARL